MKPTHEHNLHSEPASRWSDTAHATLWGFVVATLLLLLIFVGSNFLKHLSLIHISEPTRH